MTDPKLINDICLISREGICILDMRQVAAKAKELGLTVLAEAIDGDLKANKVMDGQYFPAIQSVLGAA